MKNEHEEHGQEKGENIKEEKDTVHICALKVIQDKNNRQPLSAKNQNGDERILIGRRLVTKSNKSAQTLRVAARRVAVEGFEGSPKVRRVEWLEEHISNTGIYSTEEDAKVYVLSGLSLYATINILHKRLSALVDCGAGINLINERVLASLMKGAGQHAMDVISVEKKTLRVKVANDGAWNLQRKATIKFEIGGQHFEQEFWIAKQMTEDVLFGIPALRVMSTTLHIADIAGEGADHILLRKSGMKVPLHYHPKGVTAWAIVLSVPLEDRVIMLQPGQARTVQLVSRSESEIIWSTEEDIVTGLVSSAMSLVTETLSEIDRDTGITTVILNNPTSEVKVFYPGDEVALFDPVFMDCEKDQNGDEYLFATLNEQLAKKITYRHVSDTKVYSCHTGIAPASPFPLGIIREGNVMA